MERADVFLLKSWLRKAKMVLPWAIACRITVVAKNVFPVGRVQG